MNLSKLIFLIVFLSFTFFVQGQNSVEDKIISNTQGLKLDGYILYECEGFEIYVQDMNIPFNEKSVNEMVNTNDFYKDAFKVVDKNIKGEHFIFEGRSPRVNTSLTQYFRSYIFPLESDKIRVIVFDSFMKRDSTLENVFIQKILDNTMPDSIHMEPEITNLHFANRKIELDLECHWEGAHNIQCPKQGQMSWAEFRTKNRARRFLYKRIQLTKSQDGSLLEEEKIKVIFQGVETIATKMIIKINISEAIMGGSNELVIYNLIQKIDDKFIACTMSYFTDSVNYPELPPLIAEVMKIKK